MTPDLLDFPDCPPLPDERWPDRLSPLLTDFAAYLDRCRPAGGGAARLEAFDLLHVPELVAHLILIDPVTEADGAMRFHFRFVGTWHVLSFGHDVTGRHVDELYGDPMADHSAKALSGIVATGEAHYWRRPNTFENRRFRSYQRIMAPLADEAGRVARLVGCYDAATD